MPFVRAAALLLGLFSATLAHATAQRTFVSTAGVDNPACSLVAPCRAFGAAITAVSPGGEVIALESGGYGPVTITKSVSIIAPAGIYAGISVLSGDGVTVNAPAATVLLRGLSISGQGTGRYGIFLQAAGRLRIENCIVSGLGSDGINFTAVGAELIVLDTIVRDNGGTGIGVAADLPSISLNHVRSEHNTVDGFHVAPTAGSLGAIATVADSVFTHNGANGIGADTLPVATTTITVERSVMASNGGDGFVITESNGSGVATVSRSTINDNGGNGISMRGNVVGGASENVVKRNSGYGALVSTTLPMHSFVTLSGNFFVSSLTNDISATGSGANISISANTLQGAVLCDNNSVVNTASNNVTTGIFNTTGCFVIHFGLG